MELRKRAKIAPPLSVSQLNFSEIQFSQPTSNLSLLDRLRWLQNRRSPGIWVHCDSCCSWRYLPRVIDKHELPLSWKCSMHSDQLRAKCHIVKPDCPPTSRPDVDVLEDNEYTAGSLVWAKVTGVPWWPAMVADSPETESFYRLRNNTNVPMDYHVVFLYRNNNGNVIRFFCTPAKLKPFANFTSLQLNKKSFAKEIQKALLDAINMTMEISTMSLNERLTKFSFLARYSGSYKNFEAPNKKKVKLTKRISKKNIKELCSITNDESIYLTDSDYEY